MTKTGEAFGKASGRYIATLGFVLALSVPLGAADAAGFSVLYSFKGGSDGAFPFAGVIVDAGANLYGTTEAGGGAGCGKSGCGTVFKIAPGGTETVLYAFKGGSDGDTPDGALLADAAGNLYGTTTYGGIDACAGNFCGTVFKVASNGTESLLHAFHGGSDGAFPNAALIADAAGNLYGTTESGGGTGCGGLGCGTVFEIAANGTETVLHAFKGGADGEQPESRLIANTKGYFFGTTYYGGSSACLGLGCGTVFRMGPHGHESVLYAFQSGSDGEAPAANPLLKQGDLFGTTTTGGLASAGCAGSCGTVFKVAPDGSETVFYSFTGGSDGGNPYASLITDKTGYLFGTTFNAGLGSGTVFSLSPTGTLTTLHAFKGGNTDGAQPIGGLIKHGGKFYGTTKSGGSGRGCGNASFGCGTVFVLTK